jgi:hypothetical protein
MSKKLFECVGGNKFKLITENDDKIKPQDEIDSDVEIDADDYSDLEAPVENKEVVSNLNDEIQPFEFKKDKYGSSIALKLVSYEARLEVLANLMYNYGVIPSAHPIEMSDAITTQRYADGKEIFSVITQVSPSALLNGLTSYFVNRLRDDVAHRTSSKDASGKTRHSNLPLLAKEKAKAFIDAIEEFDYHYDVADNQRDTYSVGNDKNSDLNDNPFKGVQFKRGLKDDPKDLSKED